MPHDHKFTSNYECNTYQPSKETNSKWHTECQAAAKAEQRCGVDISVDVVILCFLLSKTAISRTLQPMSCLCVCAIATPCPNSFVSHMYSPIHFCLGRCHEN